MVLQLQDYDAPHQNMICVLRYDNVNTLTKMTTIMLFIHGASSAPIGIKNLQLF
jgi:hypothetical protein